MAKVKAITSVKADCLDFRFDLEMQNAEKKIEMIKKQIEHLKQELKLYEYYSDVFSNLQENFIDYGEEE